MFPVNAGFLLEFMDGMPPDLPAGPAGGEAAGGEAGGETGAVVASVLGGGAFGKYARVVHKSKRVPILAMRDMTEEDEELMVLL